MELSALKNLRRSFNRFCFQHRNWGIPNLMLFVSIGCGVTYLYATVTQNPNLYYWLVFSRDHILEGQVWRLITYPLTYPFSLFPTFGGFDMFTTLISLICYYSLGRAVENVWGTFKLNLFYFSGILLMDIYGMIFPCMATADYVHLSLLLAFSTLYPNTHFLLFFIIPVKAWVLALLDLCLTAYSLFFLPFPYNFFPVVALANYFLYFGKDVLNLVPVSWQANFKRLFRKKKKYAPEQPRVVPFPKAGSYEAEVARPTAPYTHRCTVCGRTDVSHPDLEFRYCSRCQGYHCYCEDHINNHSHIT